MQLQMERDQALARQGRQQERVVEVLRQLEACGPWAKAPAAQQHLAILRDAAGQGAAVRGPGGAQPPDASPGKPPSTGVSLVQYMKVGAGRLALLGGGHGGLQQAAWFRRGLGAQRCVQERLRSSVLRAGCRALKGTTVEAV